MEKPGDLVQLDTLDLRPAPGVVLKQFTARDVVSRWDVIEIHQRATFTAATLFLDTLQRRLPFPLRVLQVDGGSEFAALFEAACQQRGLRLFVLPPRSPKLNRRVERANRTPMEEFYEITPCSLPIAELNRELQTWERTYNTVRPHQALGYLNSSSPKPHLKAKEPERQQSTVLVHIDPLHLPAGVCCGWLARQVFLHVSVCLCLVFVCSFEGSFWLSQNQWLASEIEIQKVSPIMPTSTQS